MKKINILKIAFFIIQLAFFAIVILTVLSLFGVPKDLQIYVVETGSMEPAIKTGSLTFVAPSPSYEVGDIITFKSRVSPESRQNYIVTHRVESIKEDSGDFYYTTKGDANKEADPLKANKLDVIGKVKNTVPYIGYVIGFAKTKLGFLTLIITPALIIIYSEIFTIYKEFNREKPKEGSTKSFKAAYASS